MPGGTPDMEPGGYTVLKDREEQRAADGFRSAYGYAPEWIASAPGRTEIGGNHTDHQRGRVLAAAVDLRTAVAAAPNGTGSIRLISEGYDPVEIDLSRKAPLEEERGTTRALVRGVAALTGGDLPGFDAYMTSSVLPGSGLSSSAAFEVALGALASAMAKVCRTPMELARLGQRAENEWFGKPCGLMDQAASASGGAVEIDFSDPSEPLVTPVEFDPARFGHGMVILDSGADHALLTDEYSAIPAEMRAVAARFGKDCLREVPEEVFAAEIPALRRECGDRAVLRAMHFYAEDARAHAEAEAIREGRFDDLLSLVRESGRSSWELLQNVIPAGEKRRQALAVALACAEKALRGRGACRVHGGGFAGTIQAFVPGEELRRFVAETESVLGEGACRVLSVTPRGAEAERIC